MQIKHIAIETCRRCSSEGRVDLGIIQWQSRRWR